MLTCAGFFHATTSGVEWACSTIEHVTEAILATIKAAGFHIGTVKFVRLPSGEPGRVVNAIDAKTGERWTVTAPTEYEAVVELARQVGIELDDGYRRARDRSPARRGRSEPGAPASGPTSLASASGSGRYRPFSEGRSGRLLLNRPRRRKQPRSVCLPKGRARRVRATGNRRFP